MDEIDGAEYIVTGSCKGEKTLRSKLKRIMGQNASDDELDITKDDE